MGKRGPKPKGQVSTIWSPLLAYALGLIVADGSLSKNGRHINFTSKDAQLICTFRKCLGIEHIKIGKKARRSELEKRYYQVQFGDVLFYSWLQERGLVSNKSKVIAEIDVDPRFFFDFLRGLWDGDGTIHYSKDIRWKNSHAISLAFTSGSYKFLAFLQKEVNIRLGTTGHIGTATRSYQLRYAKKDSKKIFDAMFYNDKLPHLHRKFTKAQKIFRISGLS